MDDLLTGARWRQELGRTEGDDYRDDGLGRADYVDLILAKIRLKAYVDKKISDETTTCASK